MIRLLLWVALKLRLRQKFWADLFWWEYRRKTKKFLDSVDLDTSNIKVVSQEDRNIYK